MSRARAVVRAHIARAVGPRRGLGWFAAGGAGLSGFFAAETLLHKPGAASDLHPADEDAGSTRGIALASALAASTAPLLRRLPLRPLPRWAAPCGLVLLLAGLALRVWSMQTLAESYTRTLRVTNEQQVTDRGPYQSVRHPGYAGSLLVWTGFSLTSGSPAVVASVAALIAPAYVHRIAAEERLLGDRLPGYDDYRARTARLVPRVW
jgi:protein-S-isoprenylcysteine O-methyltransferase Ste14